VLEAHSDNSRMNDEKKLRVLMVCLGNICRSPTAEAVLRHKLRERGLERSVEVDSAGISDWHEGAPPDLRSQEHAVRRGYDLSAQRSRPVAQADYGRFDLLLAMDDDNLDQLRASCPPADRPKLRRLMEFARRSKRRVVPDPYTGGEDHFEEVLDLIEDACDGLADHVETLLRTGTS
jgi:protein-tyrosine phosphatase